MNYSIKLSDWMRIVNVACESWKKRLLIHASDSLRGNLVTLSESFLKEMLDASNQSQKKLILSLFPDYNKEDPYKKFRDAEKKGKIIQHRDNNNKWINCKFNEPLYYLPPEDYRIKHKHQDMIDEWEASGRTKVVQYKDHSLGGPFWITTGGGKWDEAYEYRFKPEEPEYVPYTFEDAKELIGKPVKNKKLDFMYLIIDIDSSGVRMGTSSLLYPYSNLLEHYTDIDGNPLGKLKK